MLPDLTILVALILGLAAMPDGPVPVDTVLGLAGTAACVCVTVALTLLAADRSLRALEEAERPVALAAARWTILWPLLGWLGCLFLFDWGSLAGTAVGREAWLGRYVLLFLPAGVVFAFGWSALGRIEAALAAARGASILPPTGWGAVRHGIRRNAIAILPLVALLGVVDGIWCLGRAGLPGFVTAARWLDAMPLLELGLMLVLLAAFTLVLPAALRRFLSTEPLPDGSLRDLLESHARTLGLRYREIVLWNTGGRLVNAMVVGFTPGTRRIFLTDGLLRHLPEEEVLAVFAHEAGHARHHHLPLFLVLFVAAAVLLYVGGEHLERFGISPLLVLAVHLAFLWYVLLGSVSRLFEREADVYGAEHAAALSPDSPGLLVPGLKAPLPLGAVRMIRALERIERISGRSRSHRHGSIEERIQFVAAHATDPEVRAGLRRRKRRLLAATAGAALLAGLVAAQRIPSDVLLARARIAETDAVAAYEEARRLEEAGRAEEAAARWEAAYAGFGEGVRLMEGRGDGAAEQLRLRSRFNRADTALRGLRDEARARADLEAVLSEAEGIAVPTAMSAALEFQARIDLGRLLVRSGDLEAAEREGERATALLERLGDARAVYFRERLRLLHAVLEAGRGDPGRLEAFLRDRREHGGADAELFAELARDAREELERLGGR